MRTVIFQQVDTRAINLALRAGAVAMIAGLAGCSNFDALRSPTFTGSTANQQQIISGQASAYTPPPAYAASSAGYGVGAPPRAGVQANDLPPPGGAAAAPAYAAAPATSPQPYTPPKPYAANGLPTPVGQVGSAPPPRPAGAPAPTLATMGAPAATLNAQAASIDGGPAGAPGGTHLVQSGDTMYNISRRYGVSVDSLIAANGGSSVARLGQRVAIPGGGRSAPQANVQVASVNPQAIPAPTPIAAPAVPATAAAAPAPAIAAAPAPMPDQQVALAPQTGNAAAAAPAVPQQSSAAAGFRWPVRGRVISGFGKKPNGERNDGINLAVPEGTAVKAAEDGTVIYAGNELKSYGNLVLIRHTGGWVSAYAHNGDLKVKRGENISRGQVIATSGMSGGVTTPQVHFELRKDATPVDPLQHLSES